MSRMVADPVGRLASLEAARAGLKGRRRVIVNAADLEQITGITWRFLKQRIDAEPEFPVEQRGDQGVPWQFDARKVLDYLIRSAKAAQRSREARMAEVSRLAGLGAAAGSSPYGGDANGSGSAAEIAQHARALNALIDAQGKLRLERQKQGLLVPREMVSALLTDIMTTMQAETLAVTSRMDPAGQWDVGLRAQVEEELRNVLTTVRDRLQKQVEAWRGPLD